MCDNSRSRKQCCYAADERKRKTKHGQRNKFVDRIVQSEREQTDQAIYIENLPGRQKPGSVPDDRDLRRSDLAGIVLGHLGCL